MLTPEPLEEITERSGVPHPNPLPHQDLTVGMVLWNEARRLPALLALCQIAFAHVVIVVQESTDNTLEIAQDRKRPGDKVIEDVHHGHGDASMPLLLRKIDTDWAFIIAGDERPDIDLLRSLWTAGWWAESKGVDGLWIDFISTIDKVVAKIDSAHMRMFKRDLGWPGTMHSRAYPKREGYWPYGRIHHDRSLDEMIVDYLRYLSMSKDNKGWRDHNELMIREACHGIAAVKGWPYVESFDWWPRVKGIVHP